MKRIARHKSALLVTSLLLLWGIVMTLSYVLDIAALPHELATAGNSYLILTFVHLASLLIFYRLKHASARHAHKQIIWLFLPFLSLGLLSILVFRFDYSAIVLLIGCPTSLGLLLWHQSDMAKNDNRQLFTLAGSQIETQLQKLNLPFNSLSLDALESNQEAGLLLISQHDDDPNLYRFMLGFELPANKKVIHAEQYIEDYRGQIDTLSIRALVDRTRDGSFYEPIKRMCEIGLTAMLLLITSPLLLLATLLIKLTSPGPVIFTQERVGLDCKIFTIFKFRTMHLDAEASGQQFATKGDPRIIKFGNFLRKSRIDELPQLWNVLRGDMSLIGPRPEQKDLFDELCAEIPQFALRQLTRPGITGWAQVVQGYADDEDSSRVKLSHDLYYLKYRGPTLDLLIITRTLTTILTGFGSR